MGGFFERLIGIMKNTLSKAIGRALLKYEELEEVLLDVESLLNNRSLCYAEEEFEQPVITPNLLLRGQPAHQGIVWWESLPKRMNRTEAQ